MKLDKVKSPDYAAIIHAAEQAIRHYEEQTK